MGSFMQVGYRIIGDMSHINCFFPRGQSSALRCDSSSPRSIQHRLGKNGSAGQNCTVLTINLAKCGSSGCCWVDANSTAEGPNVLSLSPSSDSGVVRSGKDSRQGQSSGVVLRAPFERQIPRRRLFIPHPSLLAPNNVYSRHTLISPEEIRKCQTKSRSKHLKTAER